MGLNASTRSPLGAFYRSPLGMRAVLGAGPTPPADCWALDVGFISIHNNLSEFALGICGGGTTSGQRYENAASFSLSCVIRDCVQTGYRVRGRTSGHEEYMGVLEKIPITGDCDTGCALDLGGGKYSVANRGFWNTIPTPDVWAVGMRTYTLGALGFVASERCDLLITACWENAILSIASDPISPTLPIITTADPHQLRVGMRVTIADSQYHNGQWSVLRTDSATLATLYRGANYVAPDSGTLKPMYDYKP